MNLDVLKTHSAFQEQVRASARGCARNWPAGEERADAAAGGWGWGWQEPEALGGSGALQDLTPWEANVVPS